ncbi:MAG: hypothetical protein ACOVQE_06210 [Chitinophagaceae bacterium]
MAALTQDTGIADIYFNVLKNLNTPTKLALIEKLSNSIEQNQKEEISLQSLFGAYQTPESAEELIEKIRDARIFNRTIESL